MSIKNQILKLMADRPKPDLFKDRGWTAHKIDHHFVKTDKSKNWKDSIANKSWPTHGILLELERQGIVTRYCPGEKKGFKLILKQKGVA